MMIMMTTRVIIKYKREAVSNKKMGRKRMEEKKK
jgi:hypothetical protein